MFLDEAIITVRSGSGGNGCVSFRREKFVPRGGPDGGDGGNGGSVYLRATAGLSTLSDVSRRSVWEADSGKGGGGNTRSGRKGSSLWIDVPAGTIAREVDSTLPPQEGQLLGDLLQEGDTLLVAQGGRGGRGNKCFATPTHQVPREAEEGQPGEEKRIYLELKLLADVGLVGLPNAGKSTLLSRVSAARPKVADYPFTTLNPNLGIVDAGDYRHMVLADIPGIIEGAHEGVGLGIEFLRHIERTRVLVHLVSVEPRSVEAMLENYRIIEQELVRYSTALAEKPRIAVVSKVDILEEGEREVLREELSRKLKVPVMLLSAVAGLGVREILVAASRLLWPQE